jgi:hypothetical protein
MNELSASSLPEALTISQTALNLETNLPVSSYSVPIKEQNRSVNRTNLTDFPPKVNSNNASGKIITFTTEGEMNRATTSILQVEVSQTKIDPSSITSITQSPNVASEIEQTKDGLTDPTASPSGPPEALLPVSNNDGCPSSQTSESLTTSMLVLNQLATCCSSQDNTLPFSPESVNTQRIDSEGDSSDKSSAQFPTGKTEAGSGKLELSDAVRTTELSSTTGSQEYTSKVYSVTSGENPEDTYTSADTTQEHSDFSTSFTSLSPNPTSNFQGNSIMEESKRARVIPRRSLGIALGSSAAAMFMFLSIMIFHHSCTRWFQSAKLVNPLVTNSPKARNRDTQRTPPEISRFSADTR